MSNEMVVLVWSIVNALVSVLLEVVPGLKDKWSDLSCKPLILLGFALVVPVALWGITCYGNITLVQVECEWQGAFSMLVAGFTAFLTNQTAFAVGTRNTSNAKARIEYAG